VRLNEIVYFESAKHRTIVHTLTGKHAVVAPLKDLEAKLENKNFFRVNSGNLVNLNHVMASAGNNVELVGGVNLPISRARKKDFLTVLTNYLGAGGI
jgi:DNA-binding LytR/AlgR family response regulator